MDETRLSERTRARDRHAQAVKRLALADLETELIGAARPALRPK